mmetsp:Transcript_16861/g.24233  ORF Transcript_16861/g.24233 Transcript_16861/m.24233 type:complete len:133 (+) Transcript_16861:185-583(+)
MVDPGKLQNPKHGLAILLVGKTSRVLGTFWAFRTLSNSSKNGVPVPIFLFFLLLACACVMIPVQQPWRGRRIGIQKLSRVCFVSDGIERNRELLFQCHWISVGAHRRMRAGCKPVLVAQGFGGLWASPNASP